MDIIQFIYSVIGTPLGYLLYFIYHFLVQNVGIAILIFTFIIKLALLPIYIRQQKNTAKTQVFAPKVQEIQTKYKNNQQKQQEELAKLQQQGYKPMSGCGSMLLSFLILFGVIDVVYKPMTHIVHMTSEEISSMVQGAYDVELTSVFVEEIAKTDEEVAALKDADKTKHDSIVRDAKKILDYYNSNCLKDDEKAFTEEQLKSLDTDTVKMFRTALKTVVLNEYNADNNITVLGSTDLYKITDAEKAEMDKLATDEEKAAYKAEHAFSDAVMNALNTLQAHYGSYKATGEDSYTFTATSSMQRELYALECFGTQTDKFVYKNAFAGNAISPARAEEISELYVNLNFLGIPLGQVPSNHMEFPIILIPIISFLMCLAQTFISNKLTMANNPQAASAPGMGPMKIMMFIMPLMSVWIAFTVPAGAGFYWTISYAFGIIQTILLNKLYNPKKLKEQAERELNERQRIIETTAKEVAEKYGEESVSQREINRRKLAEARKADALKYGEEYHEDDSDD